MNVSFVSLMVLFRCRFKIIYSTNGTLDFTDMDFLSGLRLHSPSRILYSVLVIDLIRIWVFEVFIVTLKPLRSNSRVQAQLLSCRLALRVDGSSALVCGLLKH